MKKLLFSVLFLMVACAASASIEGTYTVTKYAGASTGNYTFASGETWDSSDATEEDMWQVEITLKEGDTYNIYNLIEWYEDVEATYDAEAGTLTIAAGAEVDSSNKYYICGGLQGYTTASGVIAYADKNNGWLYASRPLLDIVLKVDGAIIVATTPILIYNNYYAYDGYHGMAYEIYSELELKNDEVGVDTIEANSAEGDKEYYNLQGIRVENPANGVHVVRQGSKISKTLIR